MNEVSATLCKIMIKKTLHSGLYNRSGDKTKLQISNCPHVLNGVHWILVSRARIFGMWCDGGFGFIKNSMIKREQRSGCFSALADIFTWSVLSRGKWKLSVPQLSASRTSIILKQKKYNACKIAAPSKGKLTNFAQDNTAAFAGEYVCKSKNC